MSNTDIDLNGLGASGDSREVFGPINAWAGASGRVYVSTHRGSPNGAIQIGYDPELDETFVRAGNVAGEWSAWTAVEAPPDPPIADAAKAKAKAPEAKAPDKGGDPITKK